MRAATLLLTSLLLTSSVWAQASADTAAVAAETATPSQAEQPLHDRNTQRIENIRVEDGGSRVDELRVGGETKRIQVQPKVGNLPAYEVQPQNTEGADGTNGRRVWRALQF